MYKSKIRNNATAAPSRITKCSSKLTYTYLAQNKRKKNYKKLTYRSDIVVFINRGFFRDARWEKLWNQGSVSMVKCSLLILRSKNIYISSNFINKKLITNFQKKSYHVNHNKESFGTTHTVSISNFSNQSFPSWAKHFWSFINVG